MSDISSQVGLISADEAARLVGVSRRTITRQIDIFLQSKGKDGIGPKYVISHNVVRVPRASVARWLDRSRRVGDAPPREPVI